jgi:hypothetical protein
MYKLEYDNDGCLMMVKIEEVCLFTPKAVDGMIARLRSLRDKHWHDWPGDRHNRKALEMAIRNDGLAGLFATGALDFDAAQDEPGHSARKPARHKRGKLAVVAGGKAA